MNPKVFIIHASEDKERFVVDFAVKLRGKGVEAWLDKWEMLPGDSLVDRIFEEGLKNAQAIIVMLSNYSVNKPWVREELNAGMVKRINEGSKLIPVIIEDCQIPECLKSTVWEKISDLNSYNVELDRIVLSIYGKSDKPPLGEAPKYTKNRVEIISDLTEIDTMVLKISCDKAVEIGISHVEPQSISDQIKLLDISEEQLLESLEVLDNKGYIKASKAIGGSIRIFSITFYGFDEYARVNIENYDSLVEKVALKIVNENKKDNISVREELSQPTMIINHIFESLEGEGLIKMSKAYGGGLHLYIYDVSPELKRRLKRI